MEVMGVSVTSEDEALGPEWGGQAGGSLCGPRGCDNVQRIVHRLCAFLRSVLILLFESFRPPPPPPWRCSPETATTLTSLSRRFNGDSIYAVCYFVAKQHSPSRTTPVTPTFSSECGGCAKSRIGERATNVDSPPAPAPLCWGGGGGG